MILINSDWFRSALVGNSWSKLPIGASSSVEKVAVLLEKVGRRCAAVGAWMCRGWCVGMVMCKRGCATVVAEGGRV